ncbi:hypothetical protein TNCV_3633051 [Trichonephila clavipes]|nr:hypothetical protein TNCV_3633051 [Trichonephila clavipes]
MDDNESPHRAHIVNKFHEKEDICRIDWHSRSPDLIPIEHVWDDLERAIFQSSSQGVKSRAFGRMGFVATHSYRHSHK